MDDNEQENTNRELFLTNLTRNVTAAHLTEIFGQYGEVEKVDLEQTDKGMSRGSAYITFKTTENLNQAMLHLDGGQLDGQIIKATFVLVSKKRRREDADEDTSGGRGRRGSSPSPRRDRGRERDLREPGRGGNNIPDRNDTGRGRGGTGRMDSATYLPAHAAQGRFGGPVDRYGPNDRGGDRGGDRFGGGGGGRYGPGAGAGARGASPPHARRRSPSPVGGYRGRDRSPVGARGGFGGGEGIRMDV